MLFHLCLEIPLGCLIVAEILQLLLCKFLTIVVLLDYPIDSLCDRFCKLEGVFREECLVECHNIGLGLYEPLPVLLLA